MAPGSSEPSSTPDSSPEGAGVPREPAIGGQGGAHRTFGQRRRDAEALAESLPKRQREVLTYLLRGDAPKQIAPVLGVTIHTVNEHIKEIHRHFNVASRAELLALFVPTWY